MRPFIMFLLVSQLLACADRDDPIPSGGRAPRVREPSATLDTAVPDTMSPDTLMARDTAQSGLEY
jgi:hypothetical protein